MARTEADLTLFMLASDYNPAHYKWRETELSALGDCRATAEVIKKRLEDNDTKVMEMYAIEHKGEKTADSKSKEHHRGIDETKLHYHIVVKFESKQATLKEIAKYIGVRPEVIEKPKSGRHSYDNMLSYLTHIKYEKKIPYTPEDVLTLAGIDYMLYYNERKERWIKARAFVAKKGGKTLKRLFQEAAAKMESGELCFADLASTEYRKLLFEYKYLKLLQEKDKSVIIVAESDFARLHNKIKNGEITSMDEIIANDEWKLAYLYNQERTEETLKYEISIKNQL